MTTLRLTLPLPPSVNNQYVTVGKRRVLSGPAKAFRRSVAAVLRQARTNGKIDEAWLGGLHKRSLACDLVYYFETPYRRDLDGGLKITLDAVCDALDLDDRYIVSITLFKQIDPLQPRVELELAEVRDWRFDDEYSFIESETPE